LISETSSEIDSGLDVALRVDKATFQWEQSERPDDMKVKDRKKKNKGYPEKESGKENQPIQREPFSIKDLSMEIPRGQLCAIVGPVGSGKSSMLLGIILRMSVTLRANRFIVGIIGEMRRTNGSCTLGGSVAYCAQSAWIRNATLVY
jgi:ABC-type transport system involved in cytochrome bd biosynthesis fused ATPase/permease subunit